MDGTDGDKDGLVGVMSGGSDCNDSNFWVYFGADDLFGD